MRVAVIGGGIIGLAVAEELVRRRARVLLLERNTALAREASFAAAGILSPQSDAEGSGPFLDLLLAGAHLIPEAAARLEAESGLALDYQACGMLGLAFSEAEEREQERLFSWQSAAGIPVERWTAERIRREEPAVDGPARGGLFWPKNARIDPVLMAEAYARLIRRGGAEILEGCAVSSILVHGNRAAGVRTSAGELQADAVVNCAGPWAGFDPALPFQIPCVPVRGQILRFLSPEPLLNRIVHSDQAYLVQRGGGRFIAGSTLERAGFDRRVTEEGRRSIREGAARICSRVSRLALAAEEAGLRPDTPDHLPVLGETPIRGLFAAAGHYRNGILLAPITGRLIADAVTGKKPEISLAPFRLDRFLAMANSQTEEGTR